MGFLGRRGMENKRKGNLSDPWTAIIGSRILFIKRSIIDNPNTGLLDRLLLTFDRVEINA